MAFHADPREARGQQPPGKGGEFNANRRSGPRREDGGPTGYGTATGRYDVPALGAATRRYRAALWARSSLRPEALIVPEITSIVRRPLPGRRCGSR
jgi:hypothetical protein